jgi:hypothetical protein
MEMGNRGCLLIDRDASFTQAMPRNDDGSSSLVALPFNFDFYGTIHTSCYINNNGNVSFGSPYGTYTSSGFPINTFPMLAPFWADVDTRNAASGLVWYKITSNRMVVIWENVGYYASMADKRNTFELIFTDGTDPLIGLGNTVAFCYDDMQWTTGSASGGAGGFGGVPATVGLNKGNGIDYAQIGRFGSNTGDYDGPYGNTDGINFLDCKTFIFNTSFLSNVPPIAVGLPSGPVQLNVGDSWNTTIQYLSPEVNQSTTAAVDAGSLTDLYYTTTSGNVATVNLQYTADCSDIGTHTILLTATDNFNIPGVTVSTITIEVTDNTPPVAQCQNIIVELDENGNAVVAAAALDFGSTDECGIASFLFDAGIPVCATTPEYTSLVISAPAGTIFTSVSFASYGMPEGSCGNFSLGSCHATNSLDIVSSYLVGNNSATIPAMNYIFGDPCYGIVKRLYVQAEYGVESRTFTCADLGDHEVTLLVTDESGNFSTCEAVITVIDNIPPVAVCEDISVTLSGGLATITPEDIENGSYDNCGSIVSMSISRSEFTCDDIGNVPVTLTVTNDAGLSASCTANVTVVGEVPSCSITAVPGSGPVTGGPPTTIYIGYGAQTVTLSGSASGGSSFTYAWSPSTGLSCTDCAAPVFTATTQGNFTFTLTVTNEYGCSSTCEITICVLDVRVPGTNGKKVYLCHVPPGNPGNPQTLSISVNAVPGHIPGHEGDHLGSCNQSCDNLKAEGETGELIASADDSFSVIIYPNPFTSDMKIMVESESAEPVSLKIYDISGIMVQEIKAVPETSYTAGNELRAGLYTLRVQQGDQIRNVKIIKQR